MAAPANLQDDAVANQQTTLDQRRQQAEETVARLDLNLPLLLDEMDNRASVAFAAWPERLVLVGADRRIADPGKPGPWGFSPEEARPPCGAARTPLAVWLSLRRCLSRPAAEHRALQRASAVIRAAVRARRALSGPSATDSPPQSATLRDGL